METRKHLRVIIFLMIFLTAAVFCSQAFAENLLKNADFSELDDEKLPVYWYTDAYVQDETYSRFEIVSGDGDHSQAAMIQNFGKNDARFAQAVEVEPDSLYMLSGYIRAEDVEGGHGANLSVEGVYYFSEKVYDTDGEWKYIEYYGETGPEQEYITVFARLGGYSGESTGKAWFTDLSLTKVESIPDDMIADPWYTSSNYSYADDDDEGDEGESAPARLLYILIVIMYTAAAAYALYYERERQKRELAETRSSSLTAAAILLAALVLRMIISWFTEGYMVDVNCFLSWGHTMAANGPAKFYEATNFCDYPPLYTYVLALNSIVSDLLGGGTEIQRVVFRFIPSVCDLAGCWILYRIIVRQEGNDRKTCLVFLAVTAFNPATILNSAAWGQMDSVLCLMLMAVAVSAVNHRWKVSLPLYMAAVLVKPQALMLGPLGLTYIIVTYIRNPEYRKDLLAGTGLSLLVLAAGVIPFSIGQKWDWLIQLYIRTLASYPYATLNTANIMYILGGNWTPVENAAPFFVHAVPGILCGLYGCWWDYRARQAKARMVETVISMVFAAAFAVCASVQAPWAWCGALAMTFAFVIVISHAIRSGSIRFLPWLGGLLFILLYVCGLKMHERYIIPALLLLCAGWVMIRDRRILYVALLFSMTLFINEGIVLDNSIRLGSSMGHLNSDTVWLADIISAVNIVGMLYAVWLSMELLFAGEHRQSLIPERKKRFTDAWKIDRKLHWNRTDSIILTMITVVYTVISLLTLGSTKAPQTYWTSSSESEQIVFDLGENRTDTEILYFSQVSRYDFSFASSEDLETWSDEIWAQMNEGQCWKWKYVTDTFVDEEGRRASYSEESNIIRFRGRYIRLTAQQLGLRLNEVIFRNSQGEIIPAVILSRTGAEEESQLCSDPGTLLDEQDTMEALPAFPATQETAEAKSQPSWWNSTYFDEIYHARTAYEFLQGSVPYETSHPPLGKVFMSFFVSIFGMTPFGWRFAGALAGILMLPGMYLLGKQLTKKTWIAMTMCLMMALDCMHLTQTQIATIDSFPVLFIIFSYLFMLRFIQTDFIREEKKVSLTSLGLSGLFMGLSIASKWIGVYAGAGLAVLFFWHLARTILLYRKAGTTGAEGTADGEEGREPETLFPEEGRRSAFSRAFCLCCWCILFFIIVPVAIYLLSYIPYMAYNAKRFHSFWDYAKEVWNSQIHMINYHSKPGLGMDHPYYSPWWEWPVIGKPMWYVSDQFLPRDSSVCYSIFCFGNPVIWFGGLGALAACVLRAISERRYRLTENDLEWHMGISSFDHRYVFVIVGLLAQYLPWILVPRGTYIYHYFASIPFLMTATGLCFDMPGRKAQTAAKAAAAVFVIAAAVLFVILFPYASGLAVSRGWLDIGRNILRIWY